MEKETSASGSVPYSPRGESINKSFSGERKDQEQDILNWTSTISLSEDYQTEIFYADTILPTTDKSGSIVTDANGKNPHYAIASKLQETLKSDNNIQLELEDSTKLNYQQAVTQGYQFEFKFYETKDSTEIVSDDSTKTCWVLYCESHKERWNVFPSKNVDTSVFYLCGLQ